MDQKSESMIAERLKIARERKGINKAEAARQLNLSKIGYGRYESSERIPSSQTLEVIAQCFHTSVDYLTGKTDDFSPDALLVSKSENPCLFELVSLCQSNHERMIKRLLEYAKNFDEIGKDEES